jgi:hypothetical protein
MTLSVISLVSILHSPASNFDKKSPGGFPERLKRKARQRQEASLFNFGLEPNSLELRDTHLLVLVAPQRELTDSDTWHSTCNYTLIIEVDAGLVGRL